MRALSCATFFPLNWSRRHSCKSLAPTPAGSNSCIIERIFSSSSSVVSIFRRSSMSYERDSRSLRRYPSSSRLPIRKEAIEYWCSVRLRYPSCSWRLWVKLSLTEKVLYWGLSSEPNPDDSVYTVCIPWILPVRVTHSIVSCCAMGFSPCMRDNSTP